jgi:hypothetical protein
VIVGGSTTRNSRVTHVVTVDTPPGPFGNAGHDRWLPANTAEAACGQTVHPGRAVIPGPAAEVCKRCRRALGWPFVVTWTDKWGHTHTTDFR